MTDDEGDGFALFATNHPIEITEAMVMAGEEAAQDSIGFVEWHGDASWQTMLRAVFTAMCRAAPPEPDWDEWPSEDSLVESTVEIKHDLWRPIATAPKDGTVIDLWVTYSGGAERCASCFWDIHEDWGPGFVPRWRQQYAEASGSSFDVSGIPTHWQPVPSPPSQGMDILNNAEGKL